MPVWFELIVIMLVAYAVGIGIGWLAWGQSPARDDAEHDHGDEGGAR